MMNEAGAIQVGNKVSVILTPSPQRPCNVTQPFPSDQMLLNLTLDGSRMTGDGAVTFCGGSEPAPFTPADQNRQPSGSTSHQRSPIFSTRKNPVPLRLPAVKPPYRQVETAGFGVSMRASSRAVAVATALSMVTGGARLLSSSNSTKSRAFCSTKTTRKR